MSRIKSKFIRFGTSAGDVSAQNLPANFTPSNYTPVQVSSEGNDKTSAHLKGIDNALGGSASSPGDIAEMSFTAADNQSSPADVTGFVFSNAVVRSFDALVSITRDSTYEVREMLGIQKASSWEMSQEYVGDVTGITLSITSAGQVQYVSTNSGFTALVKFRARSTSVV